MFKNKLHLGCGKRYLEGYSHIDYSTYEHIDKVGPIFPLDYISNESIEEIYTSHTLEYFDFDECIDVLKEFKRCLKKNGLLRISVPDFDNLIKIYNKQEKNIDKVIGPIFGRWFISDKEKIYHKCVFNKNKLIKLLKDCGFGEIGEWDPLTFFGKDEDAFDDYSKAYFPHMDFEKGIQVSLNILAKNI